MSDRIIFGISVGNDRVPVKGHPVTDEFEFASARYELLRHATDSGDLADGGLKGAVVGGVAVPVGHELPERESAGDDWRPALPYHGQDRARLASRLGICGSLGEQTPKIRSRQCILRHVGERTLPHQLICRPARRAWRDAGKPATDVDPHHANSANSGIEDVWGPTRMLTGMPPTSWIYSPMVATSARPIGKM